MTIETYLLYLGVVAVFFATPPDTSQLLMMSNSVRHGLHRSWRTAAGDLTANALQMCLAAFGLTALIASSAEVLWWIKWLGVAYLAWIGLQLLLTKDQNKTPPVPSDRKLFAQGFFTSSANPFAVVFFGALFPQFITPDNPILPQLLILGVTYLVVDGLILLAWGWAAQRAVGGLRGVTPVWVNRVSGALMIAAAALLASKDLSAEAQR